MDRREAILVRLLDVAESIEGVVLAARNRDEINERQRPAILILDADEQAEDRDGGRGGRSPRTPTRVTMSPEIYLLLGGRPEAVGTALNALRASIIKAVTTDADLAALVGPNGEILYEGCATGLSRGRSLEGEMGVSFAFTYPLFPDEL